MSRVLGVIIVFLMLYSPAFAAVFSLEITNIKASGTGSPAISSSNRIFRAYTGIEYNIRAAVIGGLYPYTYSLSGQPSGMTIDSKTGEISWPDPQSSSGTITLSVTDSEATTVTATWAITVGTSTTDFIFIQSGYSGTESGSITQPYSSVENMIASESSTSKIVYFRTGTYYMPEHDDPNDHWIGLNNEPHMWIGYPGDSVVLQGSGAGTNAYTIFCNSGTIYFDNLTFNDGVEYTMLLANAPYQTVRRCKFDGLTTTTAVNNNQGMIYMPNGAGVQEYLVIQDNEFTDFTGGEAIGSLYRTNKALIENNYTHDGGVATLNAFCTPIGIKTTNTYYTIRGNKIIMPAAAATFEVYNEMTDQDYGEFVYNYVARTGGGDTMLFFYPETFYMNRNTFVGNITFYPGLSDGPYYFNNNVLIGSLVDDTYVTSTNTLSGAGVIDTDGKLTESYEAYIGSRGWQLADGTTPLEGAAVTAILPGGTLSGGSIVHP